VNRFFTRKGGVIAWRQSSDATTPPPETSTILRPHFRIVARGHALVARSYGTTADAPASATIKRTIFRINAKNRAIVWRSYGTTTTPSVTVGRPVSDSSNSGWTPSTGSDLYAMLDEVTPDALDYIVTTATGSICELALNATTYPGTSSQKLSYRASSSTGNSVIVRLKNTGGATVRNETQVLTSTDTLYEITLTAPEIAAITSGAMSVELESA